jgi:hypothetical protein
VVRGLLFALLIAAPNGFGVTSSNLMARFGPPTMQRFQVGAITVTVEYAAGRVTAVQFAPPEKTVAEINEFFQPAISEGQVLVPSHVAWRLGAPAAERFTAAPGVVLMVTYDARRTATEVRIESTVPDGDVAAVEANRLVDELAPPSQRIGAWRGRAMAMGCCTVTVDEWDNVSITRSYGCAEGRMQSATVRWGAKP